MDNISIVLFDERVDYNIQGGTLSKADYGCRKIK